MFLLDDQQKFVIVYSILWILLGLLFIAAVVLFIIKLIRIDKKGKAASVEEVDELKNKLLEALGGSDNIISSNVEMSRVTIEVNDIELINGEILKEIGASGVLLVGNKVKCSFNENAKEVQKLLEK